MAAWPLRIFALLLVCAYGFGASELFQESAHGEVVDELMQRGHQRHLLQEPPGGKGGTPGVEGAPAATGDGGAKGEKTAEETAEPTTNSTGNGLVAAQIASAQAERMKVIDCELTNSRLETELMGHQDKLEPLGAKIKKVSANFAAARAKYDKIKGVAADKQRREFAQEFLDIKTEKQRITNKESYELRYMNQYVDLYETLGRQSSLIPLVRQNIAETR